MTLGVENTGEVGFWNDIAEPRAVTSGSKTFVAWVRDDGHVLVSSFGPAGWSEPNDLITTTSPNDGVIHNSPSLMRRDDGHIIVAVCEDIATGDVPSYFISTNPDDVTAFGAEQNVGASLTSPTYPTIYQLDDGDIYYWLRYNHLGTFRTGYYKSTDGGSTWGSFVPVLIPRTTSAQYHRIGTDGTRFDIFTTDTNRVDVDSALYHFVLDGGNLHQSDGALIGAVSAGPYQADAGTLVVPSTDGAARAQGWGYDTHPACLVFVDIGASNLVKVARWDGSSWCIQDVADTGGFLGGNVFTSSGSMVKDDPDELYVPIRAGVRFEMHRFVRDGVWTSMPLTVGSGTDHAMPDTPLGGTDDVRVVWGRGTYVSDSDFDFKVHRYGLIGSPPPPPPPEPFHVEHVIADGGLVPPVPIVVESEDEYVYTG